MCSYCIADLRLCSHIGKNLVLSRCGPHKLVHAIMVMHSECSYIPSYFMLFVKTDTAFTYIKHFVLETNMNIVFYLVYF